MISIPDVCKQLSAQPVPVFCLDTCSLLDLFRRDDKRQQPRVPAREIEAATELLSLATGSPPLAHLVVPELVPREYSDHADEIEKVLTAWLRFHENNQQWLADTSLPLGLVPQPVPSTSALDLAKRLRSLAEQLLAQALVLEREQGCLERALIRVINKQRPSHKNQIKDSMNMEQCLELSRQLQQANFQRTRVWVSSNTDDFATTIAATQLHPDLIPDFTAVGLNYFTSLQAALGRLRANGEL